MGQSLATTIVLITREGLVRADFGSGHKPTLINIWQEPRPETDDAAALVEMTLSFGGRPGQQVWVFNSDFWSQTLALPTNRTSGIPADELAGALNFEAEALSGCSAFESVIGHTPVKAVGGDSIYWVVQIKLADRERIDEAVRAAGGRLAGLGHPGGLPRPLFATGAVDESWERVELWPDVVVCLIGDGKGPPDVHLLNVDPRQGRWENAVDKVRSEAGTPRHRELLAAEHITTPTGYASAPVLRLDNPAALGTWLTAWVEHLRAHPADVPLIRPGVRPISAGHRLSIALVLALLVGGLCCGHYFLYMKPQIEGLRADLEKAREPAAMLAELEKRGKTVQTRRDTLQKQESKLHQENEALARQRHRLPDLLQVLAEEHVEHLVIQKIDSAKGEPRLIGMCLRPEMADEFARKLGQSLQSKGWEVELIHKEAKIVQHDGAPWTFELQLREVSSNGSTPASQAATPGTPPRRR